VRIRPELTRKGMPGWRNKVGPVLVKHSRTLSGYFCIHGKSMETPAQAGRGAPKGERALRGAQGKGGGETAASLLEPYG